MIELPSAALIADALAGELLELGTAAEVRDRLAPF
jgi:phosphoenolpyruvate-protein kinase (PTS system EI component)